MITLGAGLLGIGLVIISVLGSLSLAAGDENTVAISDEAFWLAVITLGFGAFFFALGIWRHIKADKDETQPLIREDWGSRTGFTAQPTPAKSDEAA